MRIVLGVLQLSGLGTALISRSHGVIVGWQMPL